MAKKSKPFFKHDCNSCKYLASIIIDGEKADLYFCKGGLKDDVPLTQVNCTVISRLSSEGSNYHSGISFGIMYSKKPELLQTVTKDGKEYKFGAGSKGLGFAYMLAKMEGYLDNLK